ncbi:hypothetical protein SALCHL_006380 [Streptomyces albus subsp. chlorinus]|uniref:hypothetical protein n=1 Tax=Streptomyces albus TaxID=1888 RepID=UPI001FADAE4A|nr:hypothetical protein [Streptomyces albus]
MTVAVLHGVCDDGPAVDVRETTGNVVLSASVKDRNRGGLCTKQATSRRLTVKLDRPVGDRVVLDALAGRPIPGKSPHWYSPSWS